MEVKFAFSSINNYKFPIPDFVSFKDSTKDILHLAITRIVSALGILWPDYNEVFYVSTDSGLQKFFLIQDDSL